ncbi:RES family NAD+ phosphorylase [Iamia sp.]|uniref:RES family NAD+ phosphorylase n=1 Tax=Iamia sp. TaxID=2722710 RepID=UPI002BA87BB8|nr:RES family NAD+ phosphorylase [Iamia sp.]HXH59581.1 RES family NAD+ phosphorylase [Iamia sp.]
MTERLPRPDTARVRDTIPGPEELTVLPAGTVLVRVHPLGGAHPAAWNELRAFGPTKSRFDHQTLPRRNHPTRRIAYLTMGPDAFVAALAEWFQDDGGGVGPFDLTLRQPAITILETATELTLLDLDSGWVTRVGGNQAIRSGPRGVCRDWSRAICRHHQNLQGLAFGSSVWGPGRCLALWERAAMAFPAAPTATRQLDDPALTLAVMDAAQRLGSYVL